MEKFSRAFFSMRMMAVGMIVFLVAIAAATILESKYDIQTAKIIVYNALWFEILLVYLGLNLIANIFRYKMIQARKIAMLLFHLSFIVILIGAGITRFFGYEGMMIIREGEQSNVLYAADPHLWFKINDGKMQYAYSEKMFMSEQTSNDFAIPVEFPGHKEPIRIEYVDFRKKLIDTLIVNDSIQENVLEIITDGMRSNYLNKGGFLQAGDVAISFEKKDAMPGVHLFQEGAKILVQSELPMRFLPMAEMQKARQSGQPIADSLYVEIPKGKKVPFQTTTLYQVGNQQFVFKQILSHAKKMLLPSGKKNVGTDYLTVRITDGNQSKLVDLKGGLGAIPDHEVFTFNGLTYEMEYGSTKIELPFSIACRDFELDKYPGSDAPSSFASEVTILDKNKNYKRDQRIFMNHVMDYAGYRFFQSSYDLDIPSTPENEEGTRLSVNYDWWGTNVTYLGYLIMAIGMIFSLFAPDGRFRVLSEGLKKIRVNKQTLAIAVFSLILSGNSGAQDQAPQARKSPVFGVMSEEHADKFSSLLVQDFQGRVVPMHTMCLNLLRKIHRKDTYESYNAVQTILSMHMYPDYWFDKKIVYVSSNLREAIGIKDSYASVGDLINAKNEFKLLKEYNLAFQKLESKRNEFEKNLIKLVERYQVLQSFTAWSYMRIVPLRNDPNNTWYNPIDERVYQSDSMAFYTTLGYFKELFIASNTNKYAVCEQALEKVKSLQRSVAKNIVPSEQAVKMEIQYNKLNIFKSAYRSYLILGLILLLIFFVRIFAKTSEKWEKFFHWSARIFTVMTVGVFLFHGAGLGMRWYISGHAPWSNGYEAVVFIAWATMVAGFIFSRKNAVILAGTTILAALMIFVTELNLLDPEVTPLQPVLKSYWLMIHVAIITSSYGFLGLSAILGLLNLVLYLFQTSRNHKVLQLNIKELTYVSEMTMTIGLFMLTIGTFLGGIWANESWGRYWGWDPKETWALVSVLTYAVILHLRFIPGLNGRFLFNVVSLWGYCAILFTFFGVNFYLVGLHSYAQGEDLGVIPSWIIYTVLGFLLFTFVSAMRNRSFSKESK